MGFYFRKNFKQTNISPKDIFGMTKKSYFSFNTNFYQFGVLGNLKKKSLLTLFLKVI